MGGERKLALHARLLSLTCRQPSRNLLAARAERAEGWIIKVRDSKGETLEERGGKKGRKGTPLSPYPAPKRGTPSLPAKAGWERGGKADY